MQPPKFTEKIADSTICSYFYIFFMIFSIWAALSLLSGIYVFATTKMAFSVLVGFIISILLSFGISATSALFLYLICERALKPAQRAAVAQNKASQEYDQSAMMM